MRPGQIWNELKLRGVPAVAATYLITSWLILEVGHILSVILDIPHVVMRIVFWLLVILFPVALVGTWIYRLTRTDMSFDLPETEPAARSEHAIHQTAANQPIQKTGHGHGGGGLDPLPFIVGGLALLFVVTLAISKFFGFGKNDNAVEVTTHSASPAHLATKDTLKAVPKNSIAVLAFANMSGDKRQDYFADGLSEEVMDSLSKIKDLQVAARTSSFSFKGTTTDVKTIGAKLGVAYIMDGTVRRGNTSLRMTAELIDAKTGFKIWSEVYDHSLDDVFKIQQSVALAIINAIRHALGLEPTNAARQADTTNRQAYEQFLEGRYLVIQAGGEVQKRLALSHFDAAIAADASYALAYAGRANVLNTLASTFVAEHDRGKTYQEALAAAHTAVALAPDSAEANSILGNVLISAKLDTKTAAIFYDKSMSLGSGKAPILKNYGTEMCRQGNFDVGVHALQKAIVLDPLNPIAHYALGIGFYTAHRYAESIVALRSALQLNPEMTNAHAGIGNALLEQGKLDAARYEYKAEPVYWARQTGLAVVAARAGYKDEARVLLADFQRKNGDASTYQYVQILTQLGDKPAALGALEHAYTVRDAGLLLMHTDPLLNTLRKEARFMAVDEQVRPE